MALCSLCYLGHRHSTLRLNDKPIVVQRAGVLNITNHILAHKYISENVEKI